MFLKLADILGRLWDFSGVLLLLLLFLMNPHIYIRLETDLVGVGQYEWQTLTQPRTFLKESPLHTGLYLCELSVQWAVKREWDRKRSCYISPPTPDTFYHLCSGKKPTYFYKMPCVLKVLFLSVPISRKSLLLFIRILLGLLQVKGDHRDFHLWQSASSTLSLLY